VASRLEAIGITAGLRDGAIQGCSYFIFSYFIVIHLGKLAFGDG
jgi:hypothetical protein